MAKIDTTLRQWCPECQRATLSRIDSWGETVCAEHFEPDPDEDW